MRLQNVLDWKAPLKVSEWKKKANNIPGEGTQRERANGVWRMERKRRQGQVAEETGGCQQAARVGGSLALAQEEVPYT